MIYFSNFPLVTKNKMCVHNKWENDFKMLTKYYLKEIYQNILISKSIFNEILNWNSFIHTLSEYNQRSLEFIRWLSSADSYLKSNRRFVHAVKKRINWAVWSKFNIGIFSKQTDYWALLLFYQMSLIGLKCTRIIVVGKLFA